MGNQQIVLTKRSIAPLWGASAIPRPAHCEPRPTMAYEVQSGLRVLVTVVAGFRLMARCVSCYLQIQHERNELARRSRESLRDIGMTPQDVDVLIRRPIWRRCWQSVRMCPDSRCRGRIICAAECRLTSHASR